MMQHYQTLFENIATKLPGHSIAAIQKHRETALAQLLQIGFPTKQDEMWRYTPLKLFLEQSFTHLPLQASEASSHDLFAGTRN